MAQKSLELIFFKKLANKLTLPVCIFDTAIQLIYYNSFAQTKFNISFPFNDIDSTIWWQQFNFLDKKNKKIKLEKSPFYITATKHTISKKIFYINKQLNFKKEMIAVLISTLPIINHTNQFLGIFALFQEEDECK